MAIRSDRWGYLFIEVPRTASKAIGQGVLIPDLAGVMVGTPESHETAGDVHATPAELIQRGLVTSDDLDRLYVFAVVRNPYDAVVSLYEKMRGKYAPLLADPTSWVHEQPAYRASMEVAQEASFSDWLVFHLTRRSNAALPLAVVRPPRRFPRHYDHADRIMRFETLQHDFDEVLRDLTLKPMEIPVLNRTERDRDHRGYYDRKARWLAERAFAPFRSTFGYEF